MGGNSQQKIYDTDPSLEYHGSWILNATNVEENKQIVTLTSHSTAQSLSTVFVPFYGSQIHVFGTIPTGQGPLTANYTIDNGRPNSRTEPTLSQNSSLPSQILFVSPILQTGPHNLTIQVLETGADRNYTLQSFFVMTGANGNGKDRHGTNVGAIVGGVLGTVIFLLIAFLGAFFFWRKRRLAQISNGGQSRLPPMMYYAQSMSDGTPRGRALYMLERPGSVIDTDSKFTFGVHRDLVDEPRQSWVPVNMPPTIPESAVVSERPISDWSSYKGSSVIVEQSHAERSRFSPYTATTFSPMVFREPTPPPLPRRIAGPPLQVDTLTATSSTLGPYKGRMF